MANLNEPCRRYEETFKEAAVDFLNRNGSLESAASELGVDPADLRAWKQKKSSRCKPAKSLSGVARLRAENEALRHQVQCLEIQWDILKTTLGVLSTTVCSREVM